MWRQSSAAPAHAAGGVPLRMPRRGSAFPHTVAELGRVPPLGHSSLRSGACLPHPHGPTPCNSVPPPPAHFSALYAALASAPSRLRPRPCHIRHEPSLTPSYARGELGIQSQSNLDLFSSARVLRFFYTLCTEIFHRFFIGRGYDISDMDGCKTSHGQSISHAFTTAGI